MVLIEEEYNRGLKFEVSHYVLWALKTSRSCSKCQTYVFESRIAQGIQKWVQNNQLPALLSNVFFQKNIFGTKNHQKKTRRFVDFRIYKSISSEKFDCRTSRICWKITKVLKNVIFVYALLLFLETPDIERNWTFC